MTNSRRITYLVFFSFFAFGVFEGLLPAYVNASSLFHGLILLVSAALWCGYHAEENGVNLPKGTIIFCIILPIFGLPYYLFRGFGFKIGGLKVLWLFLFLLVCVVIYLIPVELIGFLVFRP